MRKKFKIMYPKDYWDSPKAGKPYRPPAKCMVVMNSAGIFFLYNGEQYYPSIKKLSNVLPAYDVVFEEE